MEEHSVRMNRALPSSICLAKHMNIDNNMNQPPVHIKKLLHTAAYFEPGFRSVILIFGIISLLKCFGEEAQLFFPKESFSLTLRTDKPTEVMWS